MTKEKQLNRTYSDREVDISTIFHQHFRNIKMTFATSNMKRCSSKMLKLGEGKEGRL